MYKKETRETLMAYDKLKLIEHIYFLYNDCLQTKLKHTELSELLKRADNECYGFSQWYDDKITNMLKYK